MAILLPRSGSLILTAVIILAVAPLEARAQDSYPNRPIRIVAVTASDGGGDFVARLVAQGLSERLGRQVVVDNRTGAGGIATSPWKGNPSNFKVSNYRGLRHLNR